MINFSSAAARKALQVMGCLGRSARSRHPGAVLPGSPARSGR